MDKESFWKKHNYEPVTTADGSPSLRWLGLETHEVMHHSGGAYSETQLIYGSLVREALDEGLRSFVSVGLGLGYNEWLIACEALSRGLSPAQISILSFEIDKVLVQEFERFLQTGQGEIYQEMARFFFSSSSEFLPEKTKEVRQWLLQAQEQGRWQIPGPLDQNFQWQHRYEIFLFDAFSAKTTPALWTEEFLTNLFKEATAPKARLSTYACRGTLKRALKAAGFHVEQRQGFQGKRNSTRAQRPFTG